MSHVKQRFDRAGSSGSFGESDINFAATSAKQLKEASNRNAKNCIIIGEEFMGKNNELVIKDMDSGEQELVEVAKFFAQL